VSDRGYKRSWKNLLINKRYQLRFTLFMVGLSALLMGLLGWWVVRVATEATTVAQSSIRGDACVALPALPAKPKAARPPPAPVMPAVVPAVVPAVPAVDDAADPDDPEGTARRRAVVLEESQIAIEAAPVPPPPTVPADFVQQITSHHLCELDRQARIEDAAVGKRRIIIVMVASGILLTLGLAVFGIKMTHRVAGPLYKVQLYLAKLRDGRYDKVYDLRRGDQLVEFYEHFKHAHAGVLALERADVERIRAALDAAIADGVADRSDEAKAAAAALREVLARKEKSLG